MCILKALENTMFYIAGNKFPVKMHVYSVNMNKALKG